ncbi:Hint domain-containing protein [Sulfitobacter donghicola]|uniref:Hemolysin-type calcium-binding protein n=1 Tax=Sulfitobacter donghicola DSW-25 = KCTC 12864 = JCM 14565 TaxID=1300350 RepID=A0A073IZP4_9RHOB|nr:Hint domain-containing protein [Sulfitobacter donghicola]KEJ90887.1 hemolysin-type calcium-binding protein [Sulfitobacter donghicola DSW-25 = KCTC 12864 = JCM 14565]KIN68168.1 Hemolysin-type calcium-binding protein [Sulfitobacter donghicola DSW-25 = KCTC 12864 = JCM 14565]
MPIGEVGALTRGSFAEGEVVRIDFTEPMTDAIIHLSSTNQGGNEFSLRVVSVDADGFDFILEEWEDEDGPHPATETINWIAVETGVHTLNDGRTIEAGTTTATDTASSVSLSGTHTGTPVVLTNVMSQNDPDVVDSDPFNVTNSGFDVQLQEGSLSDGVNTGEDVGWIAISTGGDGTAGFASLHSALTTSNSTFALGGSLTDGAVFGETQSMNDPEAGNVVLGNGASVTGSTGNVVAKFDEETGNGNSAHATESLGLVGFEIGQILCFTPGTMIDTPLGPRAIETIEKGDYVLTLDNGPQPVLFSSRTFTSAQQLQTQPSLKPVLIKAGSLGPNLPQRDLLVSPQHRMLIGGWRAQMMFGEDQLLAPAKGLLNDSTILTKTPAAGVTYIHLGFARHEIITANGALSESLHTGSVAKSSMDIAAREELFSLFPDLRTAPHNPGNAARACLNVTETRLIAPTAI